MRLFVIQRYTCCKVWFGGLDLWNLLLSHTSSISNPGLPLIIIALLSDKHCITQSSPPRVISAHNLTTSALRIFSLLHCSSFDWDCIVLADAFSTNQPTRRCPSLLICFLAAALPLCCTTLIYHSAVPLCCTTLLYHSAVPGKGGRTSTQLVKEPPPWCILSMWFLIYRSVVVPELHWLHRAHRLQSIKYLPSKQLVKEAPPCAFSSCASLYSALCLIQSYTDCIEEESNCRASNIFGQLVKESPWGLPNHHVNLAN